MQKIEWDWYGTWVWDYLNLDTDSLYTEAWESFHIWKKAYIQANPDLSELGDLDLIGEHYNEAMEPLFNSWLFKAWRLFYLPSQLFRSSTWKINRRIFS